MSIIFSKMRNTLLNLTCLSALHFFILLISIPEVKSQQCTPIIQAGSQLQSIPQLESSSVTLEAPTTNTTTRQNTFNIPLLNTTTRSNNYEVSIGISYIQNYFDPSKLDFAIRSASYSSYFTLAWIISETASWASVHVHYLVTAREDLRGGNFIVDNSQILIPSNTTSSYNLRLMHFYGSNRRWNARSNFVVVYAYLTGIKTDDRFLDLRVLSTFANLTQSTINVTITIANQQSPIQMLYLSYVMYTDINSPVDIGVINSLYNAVEKSFQENTVNTYIGIHRISARALTTFFTGSGRLLATVLTRQNLESFVSSFELHGFTVTAKQFFQGPILTESATGGINNRSGCANYTQCQRIGGVFLTVEDLKQCIVCRPNSEFNPVTKTCTCLADYFEDPQKNCRSLKSLCQSGDVFMNGNCYQISTGTPNSRCKINQVFNATLQTCQCRTNFLAYLKNGEIRCRAPCSNGLSFNYTLQVCQCASREYDMRGVCINCQDQLAVWNADSLKCECIQGAVSLLGGKCQRCGQNARYISEQKKCECLAGYNGSGVVCRRNTTQAVSGFTIFFVNTTGN